MFSFEKKTKCGQYNTPIAAFQEDDKRKVIYYTECECADSNKFRELQIKTEFTPIPFYTPGQRIGPICISAMSGGGKSTYANKLVEEILKLNGKKQKLGIENVFLITSATESDPAYESLGQIRVDIDHAMANVALEDFRNSIVIFDDYTNQPTKEREQWTTSLLNQLLERSRKLRCHLIICNHQQRNGPATKLQNLESQAFVLFYLSNPNESKKLLKNYLDFSNEAMNKLLEINNGRFSTCYINRNPRYIITKRYIYFYWNNEPFERNQNT